jgi:diadenosine tetraphosphate (Ap4A) HIT family hydrolase
MSIWDDPELHVNDEFVKFEKVGDSITGTILTVRAHRFDNNSVAPQLLLRLDDGEEKTVTAGQVRLKAKLAEMRPEAGDRITITLTEIEKRAGGKELKHFDVHVVPGNGGTSAAVPGGAQPAVHAPTVPDTAPPTQTAPNPAPDANSLAAAIAALSEEQKKALGLA